MKKTMFKIPTKSLALQRPMAFRALTREFFYSCASRALLLLFYLLSFGLKAQDEKFHFSFNTNAPSPNFIDVLPNGNLYITHNLGQGIRSYMSTYSPVGVLTKPEDWSDIQPQGSVVVKGHK